MGDFLQGGVPVPEPGGASRVAMLRDVHGEWWLHPITWVNDDDFEFGNPTDGPFASEVEAARAMGTETTAAGRPTSP